MPASKLPRILLTPGMGEQEITQALTAMFQREPAKRLVRVLRQRAESLQCGQILDYPLPIKGYNTTYYNSNRAGRK